MVMQQLMAMRASKKNTPNPKTQNTPNTKPRNTPNPKARNAGGGNDNDGDSDGGSGGGGGETAGAQSGEQAGGINYKQLDAAVKAGVVRPAGGTRNREENSPNGIAEGRNVSTPQSEQAAKNTTFSIPRQSADTGPSQPTRSSSGGYTSSAKTGSQESAYSKGDLVDLSA